MVQSRFRNNFRKVLNRVVNPGVDICTLNACRFNRLIGQRFETHRHQHISRTNVQSALALFLQAHQFAGIINTRNRNGARGEVFVIGMEQRFAVGQFRVIQQNRIHQITNGGFRSAPHFRRDVG